MPVSQLPVAATHINLSTLSCDQIARPDPESGNYPNSNSNSVCVAWPAVQPKAKAEVSDFFSCFGYFWVCLRFGFWFWRHSGEDVAGRLATWKGYCWERFTNTVVAFDIDETVSIGICLLAKALYFSY